MTILITVAEIKQPKEGKKMGSVIDSTGKRWGVWQDKLENYKRFETYEILEHDTSDFKGTTYYTIKKAVHKSTATNETKPLLAPVTHYDDNERRMDIFVCGALNNILSNATLDPLSFTTEQFIEIINKLKAAWKRTLGPQAQAVAAKGTTSQEFNDEIPD